MKINSSGASHLDYHQRTHGSKLEARVHTIPFSDPPHLLFHFVSKSGVSGSRNREDRPWLLVCLYI